MLTQLTIANFAIVRALDIDFKSGMSTITGETGAGKSIAIDALNLCLGGRAEASMVRINTPRADICARFSLTDAPSAQKWLEENQLDNNNECLLRRVISADGRSRGFINGTTVPLSQLRDLGQHLIQVHGQHAHQLLLKPEYQKQLLDAYIHHDTLLAEMKNAYYQWHHSRRLFANYQHHRHEQESRRQLLEYQLKELNEFAPQAGEYEQLDEEYKRQANSGQIVTLSQQALMTLSDADDVNILSLLHTAQNSLAELVEYDTQCTSLLDMLEEAIIQIKETSNELRHYGESTDVDPVRLFELEQRISRQLTLARKHHVSPQELPHLYQQLLDEFYILENKEDEQAHLTKIIEQQHQHAIEIAQRLHQQRAKAAHELAQQITHSMHQLAMPHGQFAIDIEFMPETLTAEGADHLTFNVSTNPGQPMQALTKVVSGGELSRIALAIQVITAQKIDTPALIFDEVDVGISGPTAAIIGRLLRQLGESTQVMCVTHLPQVAGCGHHHFYVSKQADEKETETQMRLLDKKARLQEIARLLAGSEVTRNTLASAKELLAA